MEIGAVGNLMVYGHGGHQGFFFGAHCMTVILFLLIATAQMTTAYENKKSTSLDKKGAKRGKNVNNVNFKEKNLWNLNRFYIKITLNSLSNNILFVNLQRNCGNIMTNDSAPLKEYYCLKKTPDLFRRNEDDEE